MQQFFSLLSWRLFTAQHVSGVSRPSSGAQWLQCQPLVLPSYRGDSRAVFDSHHDTKVKPEAVTVVIELMMMGGKKPETCWAVNKRQDNKLENYCIMLVIYLNCTLMHGLTNLKLRMDKTGLVSWPTAGFVFSGTEPRCFPRQHFRSLD